ncbi:Menaquinone reductase, iron-sulfur cluster-binding subunit [bacterium HR09]|nr:Menaquinone reductase, iron-sulfur cluster-binding subunit [bacterium HR09]
MSGQRRALNRRDFLKASGFATVGVLTACRRAPVEKAIPLLVQPDGFVPGKARYYASTCRACPAGCGLLLKIRDGRPIKLEGYPAHPLSGGGLCSRGQAQIIEVYDRFRLAQPQRAGAPSSWEQADAWVRELLESGKPVFMLTRPTASPTESFWWRELSHRFPQVRVVSYQDPQWEAVAKAHEQLFGLPAVPAIRLEKARVLASFACDFLGTWLSPVALTAGWKKARGLVAGDPKPAYHLQVESLVTVTGGKADQRLAVHPLEADLALQALLSFLQSLAGQRPLPLPKLAPELLGAMEGLAHKLWQARGQALVLSGSTEVAVQRLAWAANELLGAYGELLDLTRPWQAGCGSTAQAMEVLETLEAQPQTPVFFLGVNPVYELPQGERWARAISACPNSLAFALYPHETASRCQWLLPQAHPLESWGDWEASWGLVSLQQPGLSPSTQALSLAELLARWCGKPVGGRELVAATLSQTSEATNPNFEQALRQGFVQIRREALNPRPLAWEKVTPLPESQGAAFSVVLYPSLSVGQGEQAMNPFLQELPDPITKLTWGNAATLAPATAQRLGLTEGQVVRLQRGQTTVELPVVLVPGQHPDVVGVALGYGCAGTERFAGLGPRWVSARPWVGRVGVRAVELAQWDGEQLRWCVPASVTPLPVRRRLARTQDYPFPEVPAHLQPSQKPYRHIVQEFSPQQGGGETREEKPLANLWPEDFPPQGIRWAMAIDLEACTGCSACVVACQVENNVPVVGADEVSRHREMHWLRIDRYFLANGRVAFMPMLCQQCGHAPCETVCPVLATVHSKDGLNQQVYNRCVGTRYCANNCPYKVRRFNWFSYARWQEQAAPLLNPDVTVRSRGVMEKCTFCVQRIAAARMEAKEKGQPFTGEGVVPACAQSCPAQAITFGNLLDPASPVSQAFRSGRAYRVLEETGVDPSVAYLKLFAREGEHG